MSFFSFSIYLHAGGRAQSKLNYQWTIYIFNQKPDLFSYDGGLKTKVWPAEKIVRTKQRTKIAHNAYFAQWPKISQAQTCPECPVWLRWGVTTANISFTSIRSGVLDNRPPISSLLIQDRNKIYVWVHTKVIYLVNKWR